MGQQSCLIKASVFKEEGKPGDFAYDKDQQEYKNAIWLYNENVLHMRDKNFKYKGAGAACMRPHSCLHIEDGEALRSFGIPTGWSNLTGGFRLFGKKEKLAILLSFQLLYVKLKELDTVDTIVFPADKDGKFATGIFGNTVRADTLKMIQDGIDSLGLPNMSFTLQSARQGLKCWLEAQWANTKYDMDKVSTLDAILELEAKKLTQWAYTQHMFTSLQADNNELKKQSMAESQASHEVIHDLVGKVNKAGQEKLDYAKVKERVRKRAIQILEERPLGKKKSSKMQQQSLPQNDKQDGDSPTA